MFNNMNWINILSLSFILKIMLGERDVPTMMHLGVFVKIHNCFLLSARFSSLGEMRAIGEYHNFTSTKSLDGITS